MTRIPRSSRSRSAAPRCLAAAAATAGSAAPARGSAGPIKIGISLSLSGDFSDPGKAAQRGYKLWANTVNAHGGILGRKVQLIIQDDASQPDPGGDELPELHHEGQGRPRLRAVLDAAHRAVGRGRATATATRSSSRPAAARRCSTQKLAQRLLHAAGAGRQVAATSSRTVSCSLPKSQRPKTAAYPSLDDPFASPIADRDPRHPREGGREDGLQDDLPVRDDGHDADHRRRSRRSQARRDHRRHAGRRRATRR